MHYQQVIIRAEEFVRRYVDEHDNTDLLYHNLSHTQKIVSATNHIAKHYKLSDKDLFIVITAAWFLHLGYYKNISQPEQASIELADGFCRSLPIEEETIDSIKKCIPASKSPEAPGSVLEKIIRDADSFHLGTEKFFKYNKLKRKEFELLNNTSVGKNDWRKSTIKFFEAHQYYTDYCKEHLNKTKTENLQKLKKKQPPVTPSVNPFTVLVEERPGAAGKIDKKKKNETESPDRTIETMFRTTSSNSQRLSNQADTKAHILISVNAIIISVLLTLVVRSIDEYSNITVPVIILLLVNLVTIIFSILATRPNIRKGAVSENDLKENKVNLLFFGNFFKMNFDDYSKSMFQVMGDRQFLYLSLLRNLHEQGIVLGRKYRMLKTAYNIFMFGLIVSVIAFFIASYFSPKI